MPEELIKEGWNVMDQKCLKGFEESSEEWRFQDIEPVCRRQGDNQGWRTGLTHPRRPRGSQSGREKMRDESFQVRAEEPLGTDSHQTISKNSSGCRLLIGHKKCFVLLCPIGEQFLLSSFREFVHNGYYLATLARFVHQACACKGNVYFLLS